jgi:RimJ/RimL family protein N-acetyltransferase
VTEETIRTERLRLRRYVAGDADFIYDLHSRWEVQRYLGATPRLMASRDEAVGRIEVWNGGDGPGRGRWAVELAEEGRLLGTVLLVDIPASSAEEPPPPSGDVEIGWHFHPDAWGHGYATEAAASLLAHGFDLGLDRIVAVTYPENLPSQRVSTRIGMHHTGQTDRYYNGTFELFVAEHP